MNKKYNPYIIISILITVASIFHFKTINEFPQYKHCWAQCDRYALALGFIDNGGDLFHPQTFVYNNQFPDDFETIKNNTITSVDFPIHDYVVSILMRLFHSTNPWIFKSYILLYSILGFFFLYRITSLFTESFPKQITVLLFAISSPTLLYYQAGFLPTIPSLANVLIGLYFFFRYLKNNTSKDFKLSILFITLATLARLPFAIVLVAICSFEFLQLIKLKKTQAYKLITILISITLIICYYLYNNHLRINYGSLFLNYILPATNLNDLIEFITETYNRWSVQYFTPIHYLIFGTLLLYFILNKIRKKITITIFENHLLLFSSILLFGCVLYYLLMSFQFINHDYYFLDTFYIPIILFTLFLIIKLPILQNNTLKKVSNALIVILIIPAFLFAHNIQREQRHLDLYKENTTAENFINAETFLNALSIPKDSKILVIAPDGVNNPFILMNRKGYTVITANSEKIKKALDWPYDYVILENSKLINQIYTPYPSIINQLIKVGGNDNLTVYIKKSDNTPTNFDAFFNLDTKKELYHQETDFDSIPPSFLNTKNISTFCFSGKKAAYMDSLNENGISYQISDFKPLNQKSSILKIESMFYSEKILKELLLCVSINSNGKDILYLSNDLSNVIDEGYWHKQNLLFSLPKIDEKEFIISIFIWNKGRNKAYYDDFKISIY